MNKNKMNNLFEIKYKEMLMNAKEIIYNPKLENSSDEVIIWKRTCMEVLGSSNNPKAWHIRMINEVWSKYQKLVSLDKRLSNDVRSVLETIVILTESLLEKTEVDKVKLKLIKDSSDKLKFKYFCQKDLIQAKEMLDYLRKKEIDQEAINELEKITTNIYQELEAQINPRACISKFSVELNLTPETKAKALKIFEDVNNSDLIPYKKPASIAGAVLYFTAKYMKEKRTFKEISEVTKIGKSQLKVKYKELKSKIKDLETITF